MVRRTAVAVLWMCAVAALVSAIVLAPPVVGPALLAARPDLAEAVAGEPAWMIDPDALGTLLVLFTAAAAAAVAVSLNAAAVLLRRIVVSVRS